MIEALLIVATLVGGVAGLWFFWDKIVPWFRRRKAKRGLPEWAPGKWRSDGGTNTLIIANDLSWTWRSTFQGQWHGGGRGEVRDDVPVLSGWSEGATAIGQPVPRRPTSLELKREGEMLAGHLHTSRQYPVLFTRE